MITKEREDEFWYLIDNDLLDEVKLKFSDEEIKTLWYMKYNEKWGDRKHIKHCEVANSVFPFKKKHSDMEYQPNIEPDEFLDSLD